MVPTTVRENMEALDFSSHSACGLMVLEPLSARLGGDCALRPVIHPLVVREILPAVLVHA